MYVARRLIAYLLTLSFLLFGACTGSGGNTSYGKGGGDGAGTLGVLNARVRCGFNALEKPNSYDVTCHAVTISSSGSEVSATQLQPGVSISWKDPVSVQGAGIEQQNCSTSNSELTQNCEITFAHSGLSKVQFDLIVKTDTDSITASDTVVFPYSVMTLGKVSEVIQFETPVTTTTASPIPIGYQASVLREGDLYLVGLNSLCEMNGAIYFSAGQYIYQYKNSETTLYAGSPNTNNKDNLSHRLRVRLGSKLPIKIACQNGVLFALDATNRRILKIKQEGPLELVGQGPTDPTELSMPFYVCKAALCNPTALAVGNDGSLYIGDAPHLRKYSTDGKLSVMEKYSGVFSYIASLSSLEDGTLFILDGPYYNATIRKISKDGSVSTLTHNNNKGIVVADGEPASSSDISGSTFINAGKDGSIYFYNGNKIRKIGTDGKLSTVIKTEMPEPSSILLGQNGSIYVADPSYQAIRKFSSDGAANQIVVSGTLDKYLKESSSKAKDIKFNNPTYLAYAPDRSLYVADTFNHRIKRILPREDGTISPDAEAVTVIGDGHEGYSPDGAITQKTRLNQPGCLSFAKDGTLYFCEKGNHLVRKLTPDGKIQTVVGDYTKYQAPIPTGNGQQANQISFGIPLDVKIAKDGTLYILEGARVWYHNRIRKVTPEGLISTLPPQYAQTMELSEDESSLFYLSYNTALMKYDFATEKSTEIWTTNGNEEIVNFQLGATLKRIGNGFTLVDTASGTIWHLTKTAEAKYKASPLFQNQSSGDCGSGIINGKANKNNFEKRLQASLATICKGQPLAMALQESCSSGGQEMTFVYSQTLSEGSGAFLPANLVKVTQPCFSTEPEPTPTP